MKTFKLLFLSVCLLFVQAAFATKINIALVKKRVQATIDSLQRVNGFPGCTVAMVLPNGQKLVFATGYADPDTHSRMKTSSRMLSGSVGKTFFAAPVMLLVQKGKLSLDDKISKYIGHERWFKRIPNAEDVTIRMLMNHTSGITEYYENAEFMQKLKAHPYHTWTPIETISYVFGTEPAFKAGHGWEYADTNYLLLGYIIEKITGEKMYSLAQEFALKPFGLTSTEQATKLSYKDLAVGYSYENSPFPFHGRMVIKGKMVVNPQFEWTGGGFVTSSSDLASWVKDYYQYKFISAKTREEIQQGVKAKTGRKHLYGLGMQIRPSDWGPGYGHSGWFPGYLSDCEYFPNANISVAIQLNTDDFKKVKKQTHNYILEIMQTIQDCVS